MSFLGKAGRGQALLRRRREQWRGIVRVRYCVPGAKVGDPPEERRR
jgi:hypothetical protein